MMSRGISFSCCAESISLLWFLQIVMVVIVILQHHHHQTCDATTITNNNCPPSSCGEITNITSPFRLKGDPGTCGDKKYELSCENNVTVLTLFSGKYYVKSINYKNYTIRLVDTGIKEGHCSSIPHYFLTVNYFASYDFNGYKDPYGTDDDSTYWNIIYLNCSKEVKDDPGYVDTAQCRVNSDSKSYLYAFVVDDFYLGKSGSLSVGRLKDYCNVKVVAMSSLLVNPNVRDDVPNRPRPLSYEQIYGMLLYGFQLSWLSAACRDYCGYNQQCHFDSTTRDFECSKLPFQGASNLMYDYVGGIYDGLRELTGMDMLGLEKLVGDKVIYNSSIDIYKAGIVTGRYVLPYLAAKVILGIIPFSALLIYTYRRRHASIYGNIEDFLQGNTLMPIRYSYKEIKKMTKGFKVKLGEGGYGDVYRGNLISGPFVAIKMLKIKSNANGQEFISEVATIGRIYHSNVVRLIGFCVEGSKRALVYEYMPNGSLDKYIFKKEGDISLTCNQIYEISLGVARGISYLHQGCDMQILHFDIKPHNILLDENFIPKVSDFGLAKLYPIDNSIVTLTAARGTFGYMAPELFYQNIGGISYKADVYSFGMLLIEITSRRRNLNPHAEHSSQLYFPLWIYDQLYENREREMEDVIMEEINDVLKKMFLVALWCIQLKPVDRPSMNKVVEMLEGDIENIEMPPKPLLYPHETIQENFDINSNETVSNAGSTSNVEEIPTNPLLKYSA